MTRILGKTGASIGASGTETIKESGLPAAYIIMDMLQLGRKSESRRAPADIGNTLDEALILAGQDVDWKKKYDIGNI